MSPTNKLPTLAKLSILFFLTPHANTFVKTPRLKSSQTCFDENAPVVLTVQ